MFLFKYRLIFTVGTFILLTVINFNLISSPIKGVPSLNVQWDIKQVSSSTINTTYIVINSETNKTITLAPSHSLPNCTIIVRHVNGRLGNHLFMFASAYGLSRTYCCSLHIGERIKNELHDVFILNLTNEISKEDAHRLEKEHIVSQYSECQLDTKLTRPDAIRYFELTGYWQAHGHFSPYIDEIRTVLSFKPSIVKTILPFINSILNKPLILNDDMSFKAAKEYIKTTSSVTWIGLHLRRGDFLGQNAFRVGRIVSSITFIHQAIAYFIKRYNNQTIFIVASDDKPYCRKAFHHSRNIIVTPDDYSPGADLAILSLCTDVIVTSGSFGWWAAVLAGGMVLHDKQFPRRNSLLEKRCSRSLYYPPWFLFL